MKKLNNKGMTTIEVILCFVLISTIAVSLFATISSFNEKRIIEGYKAEVTTYKNIVTKDIQNDIIKRGLINVIKNNENSFTFVFKNGEESTLEIVKKEDGTPDVISYNGNKYPLPDLGETIEAGKKIKDLHIGNIKYSDIAYEYGIFSLIIPLDHPDLGNKYLIKIVIPIAYNFLTEG